LGRSFRADRCETRGLGWLGCSFRADRCETRRGLGRLGRLAQRKRRSRRLLVTTNTELAAIAAPASIGLRKPAAASGNAAML
jgi:hypothetical protein